MAPVLDGTHEMRLAGRRWRCAVGRGGIAVKRREGDGVTPLGAWPIRRLLFRADRHPRPIAALEAEPIDPAMGWCDEPDDQSRWRGLLLLLRLLLR